MRRKARETLATAVLLLERGRIDDAASRLYYAAFQAVVYALERSGKKPDDFRPGATRWDHRTVAEQVVFVRSRDEDGELLKDLRDLRLTADYKPGPVVRRDLERLWREAVRFVNEVTG